MSDQECGQGWSWCDDVESAEESSPLPQLPKPKDKRLVWKYVQSLEAENSGAGSSKESRKKELHCTPKTTRMGIVTGSKGRQLDFEPTSPTQVSKPKRIVTFMCCKGEKITKEVRDLESLSDIGNDPVSEILEIVDDKNLPSDAMKYIQQSRRAAVLPHKCKNCNRFCPPLYMCIHCDILLWGIDIDAHESGCQNSN